MDFKPYYWNPDLTNLENIVIKPAKLYSTTSTKSKTILL